MASKYLKTNNGDPLDLIKKAGEIRMNEVEAGEQERLEAAENARLSLAARRKTEDLRKQAQLAAEARQKVEASQPYNPYEVPYSTNKSKHYTNPDEFAADLYNAYSKELAKRGLDPRYARMLVAQDALETGWGKHYAGNWNFGNIIAVGNQSRTTGNDHDEYGNPIKQGFRNYDNLEHYIRSKIDLLNNKRYHAFNGPVDAAAFFRRIMDGGYVGNPKAKHAQEVADSIYRVYNSTPLKKYSEGGQVNV